jgi:hypothetical protein
MSLSKSESARINGAKSRGPKTPAGKAISSQNALKHGLFAYAILMHGESEEEFEALAESCIRRFEPRDELESNIVRQLIAATWRIARCWTLQSQTMNLEIDRDQEGGNTVAARAFQSLSANSQSLQLLHRYENSYDRIFNQTIRTLAHIRKNFPTPDADPQNQRNEPNGPSNSAILQ